MEALEHMHRSNLKSTNQLQVAKKRTAEKVKNENNEQEINLKMAQTIILKLLQTLNKHPLIYQESIVVRHTKIG